MKLGRILSAFVVLVFLAGNSTSRADGWSLQNLFSSKSKTEAKKPLPPTPKKPPSAMQKMGTGTKKFFGNIGSSLSPKKSTPTPQTSQLSSSAKPSTTAKKSSWNPFHKEEPKPKQTLGDFLSMQRLDP